MTPQHVRISLRLQATTAWHIGTGYGLAGYLDARTVADANGLPFIPGSTLKGRLRYYVRSLVLALGEGAGSPGPLANLFGAENEPGALAFADLRLDSDWSDLVKQAGAHAQQDGFVTQRRTNVMLSRQRGVALERRLYSVETVPPHLTFSGQISGYLSDHGRCVSVEGSDYARDLALLVAGCRALTHLGGRKSRGLGHCYLIIEPDGLLVDGLVIEPDSLLEALL